MESVAHMAGIVSKGGDARLEADDKLTPADFAEIAEELGREPLRARKIGYVAARKADKRETVETRWNGKETTNTAKPGDYIVTNLTPQRQPLHDAAGELNIYVISAARFPEPLRGDGREERARARLQRQGRRVGAAVARRLRHHGAVGRAADGRPTAIS